MKEKRSKKKHGKEKHQKVKERRTSSNTSDSGEWVEKQIASKANVSERENWMSMTGLLKTYTKEDIKPKQKERIHIDSYNPATSTRELNPYWKDGGTGLPQTPDNFKRSKSFIKPSQHDDYYSRALNKPGSSNDSRCSKYRNDKTHNIQKDDCKESGKQKYRTDYSVNVERSCNWRQRSERDCVLSVAEDKQNYRTGDSNNESTVKRHSGALPSDRSHNWGQKSEGEYVKSTTENKQKHKSKPDTNFVEEDVQEKTKKDSLYLSDEKMNKLGAKIIKAELMGNTKLVEELKAKLEAAREYRKQHPNSGKEQDDSVMLISTNNAGNSRPLTQPEQGDLKTKGGKRKAQTHTSGQRTKYFGDDDKYNLAQMFQKEKYGTNYNNEAELANISATHSNPNDDIEDIFMDQISKNENASKDKEREKQRAIIQHVKMERSMEGCEYCVDSKNMVKHMMVSCGNKVYVALPTRKSLVPMQCIITTVQHNSCVTSLDEDVWEEIMNYRKALTLFFNAQHKDVVFYETAIKLHKFPHMIINCVPLPRDVGDTAAIYFKKAILECEGEWSLNRKVVDLKGKNIRKCVPKGLPYFWIDFGMDPGFAHVIEDQHLFPKTFAEEIISGMLDLDHSLWKNPQREYGDVQRRKVTEFIKEWKSFDVATK